MSKRVLILSAFQDYRTRKQASIQQIANGLAAAGHDVTFFSTRFSMLSRFSGDSRQILNRRANGFEWVNGIRCYLWKTAFHPFSPRFAGLKGVMGLLNRWYGYWPSAAFDQMVRQSDVIIVESGMAVVHLPRIHRLNPSTRIIYYCTDLLKTVGAHPEAQRILEQCDQWLEHICVRSSKMVPDFAWSTRPIHLATFGITPADFDAIGDNPYEGPGPHVVSVGSMLFDPTVFAAAEQMPDVTFHVIGCGQTFAAPPNVRIYDEMPFRQTLPYIKHATVGIAPYRAAPGCEYLDESSLKLAQFELFGLPAVCPGFAAGAVASRVGYKPGEIGSVVAACRRALALAGTIAPRQFPDWQTVAARVIEPAAHGLADLRA